MTAPTTDRPELALFGLGYVGLTLAVEAGRAGLSVAGYDPDQEVVAGVRTGRATGNGDPTEDVGQLHRVGFVAVSRIAAPPPAMVDAVDLATLGMTPHEPTESSPFTTLSALMAGYRAHERRVGPESHLIGDGGAGDAAK